MRVTNTMIVNNFMNNLNTNLTRMDKLQNQLASGRKFAHISDDPTALIYSQAARNRLARLSHYQKAIGTAQDWLAQVESGIMELQGRVADVYITVIDAATDVKGASDKNNIAQLMAQLRDHYLDTLNASLGDKFIYAGYNTPGDSKSGRITGPFTIDDNWNLYFNGHNLSNLLQLYVDDGTASPPGVNPSDASGIFGGLRIDATGKINDVIDGVADAIDAANALLPDIADLNGEIKAQAGIIADLGSGITTAESIIERLDSEIADLPDNLPNLQDLKEQRELKSEELRKLQQQRSTEASKMAELHTRRDTMLAELSKHVNTDAPEYDVDGRVALSIGGVPLMKFDTASGAVPKIAVDPVAVGEMRDILELMNSLKADVLTFDVGPGISMEVTFNGIDLVMFRAPDNTTMNVFNLLHEVYEAASEGAPAEELGRMITPLQYAQNQLLAKTAEIGGRTNRLDLLTARYEQDAINYEKMKSDAEDVEIEEVIMYQKMAEAVYQAALSAGARIIQPTLMDFLR